MTPAPPPLSHLTFDELIERAERSLKTLRSMRDAETRRLTGHVDADVFVVPEDDTKADDTDADTTTIEAESLVHNSEVQFPDGIRYPEAKPKETQESRWG